MRGKRGKFASKSKPALRQGLSPVTSAIAVTAILAATLFIVFDGLRTWHDARAELTSIGRSILNDVATLSPDTARVGVAETVNRYWPDTRASFRVAGAPFDGGWISQDIPAGGLGVLSLAREESEAFAGVWQRGLGAYLVALLIGGAAYYQSRTSAMPNAAERRTYQTLTSVIPMGVACWTAAGKLIVCNNQYRDDLNLIGQNLTYHEVVKQLIAGGHMKLVKGENNNRLLELYREDGTCLLIDERPIGDGSFMTLVSDVTERRRTDTMLRSIREEQRLLARRYHEEKLKAEAASVAKTHFLAHLSHDIRTPLNHIIGFAELMRHQTYGPLGDARYAEYVQSIKASGEHLLNSFAAILDLTELESGQKELRADPVAVDALIDSVAQRFRAQALRAGVKLIIGSPTGAVMQGDGLGLQRMLGNIVENAVRFTPKGGSVTMATHAARDGVVIEVSDTGLGMNEERLAMLSQPFALGDATFTREGVGPGLGISIARAIAELSGGRIAIDSSLSLGTTVAISLPLQSETAAMVAAA